MEKQPHIRRVSKIDNYETPWDFFNLIDKTFCFNLDACANPKTTKCKKWFGEQENGEFVDALKTAWDTKGRTIWCNPPFSQKADFLQCGHKYRDCNSAIVFLLPNNARETEWWIHYVYRLQADEIISISPRINFFLDGKPTKGVTFSSCLVVYYPRIQKVLYNSPRERIMIL